MQLVRCVLIEDCLAPKRVGDNMVSKKAFRRGQKVVGVVDNIALTPDHQVLALRTKDGYLIPEPFLNVLGAVEDQGKPSRHDDIEYAEVIEEEDNKTAGIKDIVKGYNKMKPSNIIAHTATRSKSAINFALIGGGIGLVYAMLKGKNKLLFGAIGAIGGGFVGNYYGKKIKDNETTND